MLIRSTFEHLSFTR